MKKVSEKKILIVAFGFPPRGGSGIQRIVRFTELLPRFGWKPIVLTIPRWGNDVTDLSWEKRLPPHLEIHRIFSFDPMRVLLALKESKSRKGIDGRNTVEISGENRLLRWLKSFYHSVAVPDQSIFWLPSAVAMGLYLIISRRPRLIFTTAGPFGAALAGYCLKKLSGLPWAADFRDPWTRNPLRQYSGFRLKLEQALERACATTANGIIGVTEAFTKGFRSAARSSAGKKNITLTNGFDPADFHRTPASPAESRLFQLVYTGLFYGQQTPEYIFKALELAAAESPDFKERARFIIAGALPSEFRSRIEAELLKAMVELLGYVSHEKALELLNSADSLYLYLFREGRDVFPSKIFEYLAARKYIIASAPKDGIAAGLIAEFGAGVTVESDDAAGLAQALLAAFEKHQRGDLKVRHSLDDLKRFHWDEIVRQLADFFEEIK